MKKTIFNFFLVLMIVVCLLPTKVVIAQTQPTDTIKTNRNENEQDIYFLTRCDTSTLSTGKEIAWLNIQYTEEEFASIGIPEYSGIIKIVDKSNWEAWYEKEVNFYVDVLKSGYGFDGCEHGTLNHNVREYNCWQGGVQHLLGKAYTYITKPFYSKVTLCYRPNGAAVTGKDVKLYDGNGFFPLTDIGNGYYSSSKIYIGDYSVYVDGNPINLGVSVIKPSVKDGYLCNIDSDGNYIRNDDKSTATAYYSGHEYNIEVNYYEYDISVKYNGELSDELGEVTLAVKDDIYNLDKIATGKYKGKISLPKNTNSEDICIYVGERKTNAEFQTKVNPGEVYKNNNIEIDFYTAKVTALLDNNPMPGYTIKLDNGFTQYYGETNNSGIFELPVLQLNNNTVESPYTIKTYGIVDNTGIIPTLSSSNKNVTLEYNTLSFYSVEDGENKLFGKQYVREGSKPNKTVNPAMGGVSFYCWSLTPWSKDENINSITEFDFSQPINSSANVYAHFTKPVVDINDIYLSTDETGAPISSGATAFRLPAVSISGFARNKSVIQSFNLETENLDKVYFYNTNNITIQLEPGASQTSENGGIYVTTKKVTAVFKNKVTMSEAEEYIRNNVVFVPTNGTTANIKLTVSDEIIAVVDTTSIDQQPTTETATKIEGTGSSTLNSGVYYIDSDVTKTGSAGQNGLVINGTVYIYIPEGKTLTAKGANADSNNPGMAGIKLTNNSKLYVFGKGTLKAIGGNAGNGANGENAKDDGSSVGRGGLGGLGGNGAGAGIGTDGAKSKRSIEEQFDGTNVGTEGYPDASKYDVIMIVDGTYRCRAANGNDSVSVNDKMGTLFVADSITLSATGGSAGSNGSTGGGSVKSSAGGGAGYGGHAGANVGLGGNSGANGGTGGGINAWQYKLGDQGGGGEGADGKNGVGTHNGVGGAESGKKGNDTAQGGGVEKPYNRLRNQYDGSKKYSIVFEGSGNPAISYSYFMEEKTISVPVSYTGVVGADEQFMGWKVKTYGKTLGASSPDNPLTTEETITYAPGSTITIKESTYGDITLVPIVTKLPGNFAFDTFSLTTIGNPELYKYTLNLTKNGDKADLGTLEFIDSYNNKTYYVNSSTGDNLGTYVLTLSADISIDHIKLNGIDILDDNLNSPITLSSGENKSASFMSMDVAVLGKEAGEVTIDGDHTLTYNDELSKNNECVYSALKQTNDTNSYKISVDGEDIPTSFAQAKFGTKAEIKYSTVKVNVTTNVAELLKVELRAESKESIPLIKTGTCYSATTLFDTTTEYTLFVNDYSTGEKIKFNQYTINKDIDFYEILIKSRVNDAEDITNHEITVNGVKASTTNNREFKAISFNEDECSIKSNNIEIVNVTPSTTLSTTYIDYYTVTYALGENCTGTVPTDNTLYLVNQKATVKDVAGVSTGIENYYVAGWSFDNKNYCEGDEVTITARTTLTSIAKQDDLIVKYVDHFTEVGKVSRLPLTKKIVIPEWPNTKGSFTEGIVKYSMKGWTLDEDENEGIYAIYEETPFTPEGLLNGVINLPKTVTFNAVYNIERLKSITIEGSLSDGKSIEGISQVGQTFTIDYKITDNDGINKLVLIPKYDSNVFTINDITVNGETGLGAAIVNGNKISFDSSAVFNEVGDTIVSIEYKSIALTKGDYEFGFVLDYADDTLNNITFDNRSYAYLNPNPITDNLVPSQEVEIINDSTKYVVRVLDNASIVIPQDQSVVYSGNVVTSGHKYLLANQFENGATYYIYDGNTNTYVEKTGVTASNFANQPLYYENDDVDITFIYSGYDKQKDCPQDKADFTIKWYDDSYTELDEIPKYVGTYYIGVSSSASDYYLPVTEVKQQFTITPKPITVTIDNKSSAYGKDIVELTATDDGIVQGDENVYILQTTATKTSPLGKYDIIGSQGTNNNYSLTFVNEDDSYEITYSNITNDGSLTTAALNKNDKIDDVKLDTISKEAAATILETDVELAAINQALSDGDDVIVFVEISDINDNQQDIFASRNIGIDNAVLLNIDLFAQIVGDETSKKQIHDTNGYKTTVSITLTPVQAEKIGVASNKNYYVLREHNGEIEQIKADMVKDENNNYVFTFEADKFSPYAIFSKNKPRYKVPNTGVEGTYSNNHSLLELSSLSLLAVGTYMVLKKKKDN